MQLQPPSPASAPIARIVARSRRQAMDWSLVLASQGIEHVIEHDAESGWMLALAANEHASALAAIRQYRIENRRRPWRQTIPKTDLVFDWRSAAWVLLTFIFYRLSDTHAHVREAGIMNGVAVAHGEWWRLFTATLLHADPAHLATNAIFGFILLGLAMGRYGAGMGLLAAYLAGAAGNLVSWLLGDGTHYGLGASGVVMGALGLLATQSLYDLRGNPRLFRLVTAGLAAGTMLFVLLGLSPGTDVAAHLGGFVTGVLLGACVAFFPAMVDHAWANVLSWVLFMGLMIVPWRLALH